MESFAKRTRRNDELGSYRGWAIGGAVIVAVLLIGLALWFRFHGL